MPNPEVIASLRLIPAFTPRERHVVPNGEPIEFVIPDAAMKKTLRGLWTSFPICTLCDEQTGQQFGIDKMEYRLAWITGKETAMSGGNKWTVPVVLVGRSETLRSLVATKDTDICGYQQICIDLSPTGLHHHSIILNWASYGYVRSQYEQDGRDISSHLYSADISVPDRTGYFTRQQSGVMELKKSTITFVPVGVQPETELMPPIGAINVFVYYKHAGVEVTKLANAGYVTPFAIQ
jgi:hypothetical protein